MGKLPQNVSAVCCIERFVLLLQKTLTPSVKQLLVVHCTQVEGELWWFLMLNIYIQWDFTVRKISPINTNFAMLGLTREKKSSVPFNLLCDKCVPFIQGKSSLSFQFWQVLFSAVKNTLLCEKCFVEMVNRVSGTKSKPQSSHAHFLQKLALFPHHFFCIVLFQTWSRPSPTWFFSVTLEFVYLEAYWWCRLCNGIQTYLNEVLWATSMGADSNQETAVWTSVTERCLSIYPAS